MRPAPVDPFCSGPLGTWERGTCEEVPSICPAHKECIVCNDTAILCEAHALCGEAGCTRPALASFCVKHFEAVGRSTCGDCGNPAEVFLCGRHYLNIKSNEIVLVEVPLEDNPFEGPRPVCNSLGHAYATQLHCNDCFEIEVQRRVKIVLEGYGFAM